MDTSNTKKLASVDIDNIYKYQPYLLHGSKKNEARDEVMSEINTGNYQNVIYKYNLSSCKRDFVYKVGLYPVLVKIKKWIKGR